MAKVIHFPDKKQNISPADKLLEQFVDVCLISDKTARNKQFEELRLAIFRYITKRRS